MGYNVIDQFYIKSTHQSNEKLTVGRKPKIVHLFICLLFNLREQISYSKKKRIKRKVKEIEKVIFVKENQCL